MKKECTRREFLKTAGKGLSLLALFSGAIRFETPAAAQEETLFVNDLIRGEDQLKVLFLDKIHEEKSDCFIIMYLSQSGLDIILHDGGFDDGHSYSALGKLRREILEKAGVPEADREKYKMNMRLVISHFHTDHVQSLNGMILRANKRFAVTEAYLPQATCLPLGVYDDNENSDQRERVTFLHMMEKYHPDAMVRVLDWGETCLLPTDIGQVQLFAQTEDWGKEEKLKMFMNNYGYKGRYNEDEAIPICVLNANCLWMRVALGDYSFLFTGDVEKRITVRRDEPLDAFIDAYGEALRSDVIKYPHHGQMRAAASGSIKRSLITQKEDAICILTASDGKDDAGPALNRLSMPWLDLESGSIFFTVKDGKMTREVVKNIESFL